VQLEHEVFEFMSCSKAFYAPDNSGKLRNFEIYFFLVVAERPEEAPTSAAEKKISRRELETNSWERHIIIFIIEKKREQMKHLLNLFKLHFTRCKNRVF